MTECLRRSGESKHDRNPGANGFIGRHDVTFRLARLKEDLRLFARDFTKPSPTGDEGRETRRRSAVQGSGAIFVR